MNIKKLAFSLCTAGILAAAPVMALALPNYTLNGNYTITGNLFVDSLLTGIGDCIQIGPKGKLVDSGAACGGGGGGVASVTGSGNILSSGGANPNITTVAAPTFSSLNTIATTTSGNFLDNGLNINECVQTNAFKVLTSTGSACGAGGGGVSSVVSDTALALTASPTTGAVHIAIPTNPIFGGTVTVGNLADPGTASVGTVLSLPYITGGAQCLQLNGGQGVEGSGAPCGGGGGSGAPMIPLIRGSTGQAIPATLAVTTWTGYEYALAPVGFVLGHINVTCGSFNATDAAGGTSAFYNPLDANGLGGGTIDFSITNGTFPGSAPFSIGSVVIPDSPQAGPYVTSVTSTVGIPYTMLPDDMVEIIVSAVSGTATQWVGSCIAYGGP